MCLSGTEKSLQQKHEKLWGLCIIENLLGNLNEFPRLQTVGICRGIQGFHH